MLALFNYLAYQLYFLCVSIKLCHVEDLFKMLYVSLMPTRSAIHAVICNYVPSLT